MDAVVNSQRQCSLTIKTGVKIMDCFEILSVKSNATLEEVKKAYRRLAFKHHPDCGGNNYDFITIKTAYEKAVMIIKNGGNKANSNREVTRTVIICPECEGKRKTTKNYLMIIKIKRECKRCGGIGKLVKMYYPAGRKICGFCNGWGRLNVFSVTYSCPFCEGIGLEPIWK